MKDLSFYVLIKNPNNGKIEPYNIMPAICNEIYDGEKLSNKFCVYKYEHQPTYHTSKFMVNSKELLKEFLTNTLKYYYWSKCDYEFIVTDWPDKNDSIKDNNPVKLDVYEQLVPNIPLLVDLLWNEVKPLIKINEAN